MNKKIMIIFILLFWGTTLLGCEHNNKQVKDINTETGSTEKIFIKASYNTVSYNTESVQEIVNIKNDETKKTDGNFIDGNYTNEYLQLTVAIPEKWNVKCNKSNFNDDYSTINMFSITKTKGNSNNLKVQLNCYAKEIDTDLGYFDSESYLQFIGEMITNSNIPFQAKKNIDTQNINGLEFRILEGTILDDVRTKQKYYACEINNYILNIIITYYDDFDEKELIDIINSIIKLN